MVALIRSQIGIAQLKIFLAILLIQQSLPIYFVQNNIVITGGERVA